MKKPKKFLLFDSDLFIFSAGRIEHGAKCIRETERCLTFHFKFYLDFCKITIFVSFRTKRSGVRNLYIL